MGRFERFKLKNSLMLGNFVSNVIGVLIVNAVSYRSVSQPPPHILEFSDRIDTFFMPISFFTVFIATLIYERPIRTYLDKVWQKQATTPRDHRHARRRLLNEPFYLILFDLVVWFVAAAVYAGLIGRLEGGAGQVPRILIQTSLMGIVATTVAFFVLERTLQKHLAPYFFPEGGLYATPGTLRIRIWMRVAALLLACNLIPCIAHLAMIMGSSRSPYPPEQLVELMQTAIITGNLIFLGIGISLTILVSINLTKPFNGIIHTLQSIRRGDLEQRVAVTTNDEIGFTGDVINDMTAGLREGEAMRHALAVAEEVQQRLLPKKAPSVPFLDIAGTSRYCDQTGGDYFDYFEIGAPEREQVGVVVGDVSGHGVASALLMATARAFLRIRSSLPGSIGAITDDVNHHLCRDVEDSGEFMTLFYLVIDKPRGLLHWVRAGHEPAVLYCPQNRTIQELEGRGIPLGVNADWHYQEQSQAYQTGQIVAVGTDGIWEARHKSGEMFGKERFYALLRQNAHQEAHTILTAVITAVEDFQAGTAVNDDITLVVAKL